MCIYIFNHFKFFFHVLETGLYFCRVGIKRIKEGWESEKNKLSVTVKLYDLEISLFCVTVSGTSKAPSTTEKHECFKHLHNTAPLLFGV